MNDRKQHVIESAQKLFIQKGFNATSIQDILENSGISRGTFYNYFSSKNEILKVLIKNLSNQNEQKINKLLVGHHLADVEVFISQIILTIELHKAHRMSDLFEELIYSEDEDLKDFIRSQQLKTQQWVYQRFIHIFGDDKEPYLLDCSILFLGMMSNQIKHANRIGKTYDVEKIIRYAINRIIPIVNEVADAGEILHSGKELEQYLRQFNQHQHDKTEKLDKLVDHLKLSISNTEDQQQYFEIIDFIHSELPLSNCRKFLVESALSTLKLQEKAFQQNALDDFILYVKESLK